MYGRKYSLGLFLLLHYAYFFRLNILASMFTFYVTLKININKTFNRDFNYGLLSIFLLC